MFLTLLRTYLNQTYIKNIRYKKMDLNDLIKLAGISAQQVQPEAETCSHCGCDMEHPTQGCGCDSHEDEHGHNEPMDMAKLIAIMSPNEVEETASGAGFDTADTGPDQEMLDLDMGRDGDVDTSLRRYLKAKGDHVTVDENVYTDYSVEDVSEAYTAFKEAKAKPDFLDVDKDGDKEEPMKKALKDKKVDEAKAKPDFLDVDKDGDKEEPMKKALKDKEAVKESADLSYLKTLAGI